MSDYLGSDRPISAKALSAYRTYTKEETDTVNMTKQRRTQLQFAVTATTTALFAGYAWGDASASTHHHHNKTGNHTHVSHRHSVSHHSETVHAKSASAHHKRRHLKSLYAQHKAKRHGKFSLEAKHIVSSHRHALAHSLRRNGSSRWLKQDYIAHHSDGSIRRVKRHHHAEVALSSSHSHRHATHRHSKWVAKASHKSHRHHSYQVASWKHTRRADVAHSFVKHHGAPSAVAHHARTRRQSVVADSGSNYTPSHKVRPEADAPIAANEIVRTAYAYRGTPYRFGASRPGAFDCSGFTQYVYGRKGINIPRTAAEQSKAGKSVNQGSLKPGDLIFFHTTRPGISHVGMYVGDGKFVHAASRKSGGVRVDNFSGYYQKAYRGARRFINRKEEPENQPSE